MSALFKFRDKSKVDGDEVSTQVRRLRGWLRMVKEHLRTVRATTDNVEWTVVGEGIVMLRVERAP